MRADATATQVHIERFIRVLRAAAFATLVAVGAIGVAAANDAAWPTAASYDDMRFIDENTYLPDGRLASWSVDELAEPENLLPFGAPGESF